MKSNSLSPVAMPETSATEVDEGHDFQVIDSMEVREQMRSEASNKNLMDHTNS